MMTRFLSFVAHIIHISCSCISGLIIQFIREFIFPLIIFLFFILIFYILGMFSC